MHIQFRYSIHIPIYDKTTCTTYRTFIYNVFANTTIDEDITRKMMNEYYNHISSKGNEIQETRHVKHVKFHVIFESMLCCVNTLCVSDYANRHITLLLVDCT